VTTRRISLVPAPPTPDVDDERDEEDERDDFGTLLPELDEVPSADEDDESVVPDKIVIDLLGEDESEADETFTELDLGAGSVLIEDDADESGGALGLGDERDGRDEAPEDELPRDDEERDGVDDTGPLVNDRDLPGLDADDGAPIEDARFGTLVTVSEAALPLAKQAWQITRLAPQQERCSALAVEAGVAVAGSTDLLWLEPGRSTPVRVALEGTRIASLVLVGEQRESVVAATATGRLVRRSRLASDSERLGELSRAGETVGDAALCQVEPRFPRRVLGRSTAGALLVSDDAGASFRALEPRIFARALSATAAPVAVLALEGDALLLSNDADMSFERVPLEAVGRGVAAADEARIEALGDVVVLFAPDRGLVFSADRGHHFRAVPGIVTPTAVAVGTLDGRSYVWAACYAETRDRTQLVAIDLTSSGAEVIATLDGPGDGEAEQSGSARVERLGWDGARLFAVGEAGFVMLAPAGLPRGEKH
jgi:hypothetical protein